MKQQSKTTTDKIFNVVKILAAFFILFLVSYKAYFKINNTIDKTKTPIELKEENKIETQGKKTQ